jgi:malonyl-CoA O-methyltransferase
VAAAIQAFLNEWVMTDLSHPPLPGNLAGQAPGGGVVFRAAASYDSVAELQRDVGHELLGRLPSALSPSAGWTWAAAPGISAVLGQQFPQ